MASAAQVPQKLTTMPPRRMAQIMNESATNEALVQDLLRLLDVEKRGEDQFLGSRKPGGVGRVFGGQVIAQALGAAERTVSEEREVHSLHAYFLRGGSEDHAIDYRIERDFDGGSFSNRRVIASQQGKPILNLTASFHKSEGGVSHQDAMPDITPPADLPSQEDLIARFADKLPESMQQFVMQKRPIEIRPVNWKHWLGVEKGPPVLATWFRTVAPLADDPLVHRSILAYASDYTLLGTATVPHGLGWMRGDVQGVSLDHAVWFHDKFRADDWLLYYTESSWAGRARGFCRGKIFSRDGRLVAETAQEGLIRLKTGI